MRGAQGNFSGCQTGFHGMQDMVVSLRVESVPGQGVPSMKTVDVNIPPLDLQGTSYIICMLQKDVCVVHKATC